MNEEVGNHDRSAPGRALPKLAEGESRPIVAKDKGLTSAAIEEWRSATEKAYRSLARVPHNRLIWMTILAGATVISPGDQSEVMIPLLDTFRQSVTRRCRRKLPGMRLRGVFEFDLLNPRFVIGEHKAALLSDLGLDHCSISHDRRIMLPHLHAVVDHGENDMETVVQEFRAQFPGRWRVHAVRLHSTGSVRENLMSLSGYSTKLKVAYSEAWVDRKTKYIGLYGDEWIDTIIDSINSIGIDKLSFNFGGK